MNIYESISITNFSAAAEALYKGNKTGWMNKDQVFVVSLYDHFRFFEENPSILPNITNIIKKFDREMADDRSDYEKSRDPDEQYGWHGYECYVSDKNSRFRKFILSEIYKLGWGRIGTFKKNKLRQLEVETVNETVSILKPLAEKLAEWSERIVFWNIVEPYAGDYGDYNL